MVPTCNTFEKILFSPENQSPVLLRKLEGVGLFTFYRNEVKPYGVSDKNQEGYADPTVYQALTQIKNDSKRYRPVVYSCSPFSGDVEVNTSNAKRYSRFAVDAGAIPFVTFLYARGH